MALTAYFPCDEGSGNILHDTINGHNLTRSGGDLGWVAGHGDHAYAFSVITSGLPSFPETQAFTWGTSTEQLPAGSFSFAAWVYRTSGQMGPILAVENGGAHMLRNGSTYIDQPGNQPVDMNVWFHLVYVETATTYTYYINGVEATSGVASGFGQYLTIQLGAFADAYMFPGYFNDIFFFDHALSQEEITLLATDSYFATQVDIAASLSGSGAISAANLTSYTRTYLNMGANLSGAGLIQSSPIQRLYELPANTTPADLTLDGMVYDDMSLREAIKVLLAVNAAKSAGGGTSNINFRDIKDAKNKVEAVVDAQGNRLSVTINRD